VYVVAFSLLSVLHLWILYHVPVMVIGVRDLFTKNQKRKRRQRVNVGLPTVSILVPVKNEEKVVGRLLEALLNLDYPPEKMEIIVVEDGSTDKTVEVCKGYVRENVSVRLLSKPISNGKPSALNYAFKRARGEIVGVFDADNVPEPDALLKVAESFQDPSTAAVQGKLCSINADENLFTKIVSFEEAVLYEAYPRGKDTLNLSNHLSGTCSFIRRRVIENIGGWDEDSLTEDMEMSARLLETNNNIKYDSDVRSWQETPSTPTEFLKQRTRWCRGCMEVALSHGNLLRKINKRIVDAEISFAGPYMLLLCLVGYLIFAYSLLTPMPSNPVFTVMIQMVSLITIGGLLVSGITLFCLTKPRAKRNLLWIPLAYVYWGLHLFAVSRALVEMILRRPRKWQRTEKRGTVTCRDLRRAGMFEERYFK
jgi:cellulose synthase/poly-beta-1,6-N-acetylglucosamine synthase-like glycosyltransferase